jgi:hypothetical protein
VLPDDALPYAVLQTFELDDARAAAASFSKNVVEVGPAAAFGRAPV